MEPHLSLWPKVQKQFGSDSARSTPAPLPIAPYHQPHTTTKNATEKQWPHKSEKTTHTYTVILLLLCSMFMLSKECPVHACVCVRIEFHGNIVLVNIKQRYAAGCISRTFFLPQFIKNEEKKLAMTNSFHHTKKYCICKIGHRNNINSDEHDQMQYTATYSIKKMVGS